ncbi:hypothetical protein ACTNEO_11300 [Gracilibacillus sp. HCP3S3_G5_1]|uniref:hypothetical protein n=1 Tax=unclassified Gracilibacillus TaxID=2625209 RepID=UPI003F8BD8E7
MTEFMSYDPWANIRTKNGIPGDEIISALQKSIRRGLEEEAVEVAYEMYITSPQFEDKLWRRLQAIAIEDIGFGNVQAPVIIHTLNQIRENFPYNDGDRPIFFVHAVRFLCQCEKDRSSDWLKNIVIEEFNRGKKPEIPEFALDIHTQRGREQGKDILHFLHEASQVIPETADVNTDYKERLLKIIASESGTNKKFSYNSWQA